MKQFFKKAYEIYHAICMIGFSLFLNFLVGLIIVWFVVIPILDMFTCPF
jgi:hypothetical protein